MHCFMYLAILIYLGASKYVFAPVRQSCGERECEKKDQGQTELMNYDKHMEKENIVYRVYPFWTTRPCWKSDMPNTVKYWRNKIT